MIKRNQSSMTLLNNVMTNTIHHFSGSVHPVSTQIRAHTNSTDVSFIIVGIAVQLDLHAVYSSTVNWNRNYLQCSQTMYKEDSLLVLTVKLISSWRWHVQSMVW